jgi:hypothetical protein
MNKILRRLLFGTTWTTTMLYAQIGCMEKSMHLHQLYDPKEYHYVEGGDGGFCNCPCEKYKAQAKPLPYGQCPICKHFRAEPSLIVITKKVREDVQKMPSPISPVAFEGINQLNWALLKKSR